MTDPATLSDANLIDAQASALESAQLASQRFEAAAAAVDAAIAAQGEALTATIAADRRYRDLVNEAIRRGL